MELASSPCKFPGICTWGWRLRLVLNALLAPGGRGKISSIKDTGALWLWDFKLTADRAHRPFLYFAMPGNWGDFAIASTFPNRMIATFANEKTAMCAEVSFQIKPFHDAASWNSSRRAPGAGFFRASSR